MRRKIFPCAEISLVDRRQVMAANFQLTLKSRTFQKVSGFLHSDTVIIQGPVVHKTVVWLNPGLTCKIHWKFSRSLLISLKIFNGISNLVWINSSPGFKHFDIR